ncbi:2-dehydro-3-deoxy-D-gluconate 5-dehydrogenase [Klebsiella pneumoniae]|nr:2-dehydro-3-deoxy-D-gluconate 5-dehydrogenase [Klebsiella pneumoniae]
MILDAFSLQGKVAVVSGCDTGLGQGMALGLAEAGCDIVGINIVEPVETIERVTALGRRFQPDRRPAPDRRYSSASGAGGGGVRPY